MSEAPATPVEVIRQLGQLTARLSQITAQLRTAEYKAAQLASEANVAEAKAFLYATGPVDQRKYQAKLESSPAALEAELADVEVRCLRRELQALMTRIEVGRTYAATVRAELSSLGNPT